MSIHQLQASVYRATVQLVGPPKEGLFIRGLTMEQFHELVELALPGLKIKAYNQEPQTEWFIENYDHAGAVKK